MDFPFQQEQKHLEKVKKTIQRQIDKLQAETNERRADVVHSRKHFWDEIKVNIDTFDDYLETVLAIRQEAHQLAVKESTHKHVSNRLATLEKMLHSPFFGRIDFLEQGDSEVEKVYIGISTLRDHSGENIVIYDWRAPISSVYYDYQPGPAEYKTPSGTIEGELKNKWQYIIRNGKLESMFDTSITIGDEILKEVLGRGTDKYMNSIVATIQKEQNRIIRHDDARMLIVHGAAGSGKTSAALQRVAYLLYKYRDSINADQIILFSPNNIFSQYVSNVLPELGEENMRQVTFQEYLYHRLSDDFHVEDPYEQLEYVLTQADDRNYSTRLSSIRFKASIPFFNMIKSYAKSLEASGMVFKDIMFQGEKIVTATDIERYFYSDENASLGLQKRVEKVKDWLLKKIRHLENEEWHQEWVEETIELLSDEQYYKAKKNLAEKAGFRQHEIDDYEVDTMELSKLIVRQRLKPLRKRIQSFHFVHMKRIYKQLFIESNHWNKEEVPTDWVEICRLTINELDKGRIFYEDATPYLQLHEFIFGFQANLSIKHVVVDEAQDYSPFQFEFLKQLFPVARMTVLGDFNQAIFAHANEKSDFQELTKLYGEDKTEIINLHRSYRSTKPIIEFTRRLVPEGKEIIPFERDGKHPSLTLVENDEELHAAIKLKVSELQKEDYQSIAIICKSAAESKKAYDALSHIENLKLLKSSSLEYEQGVVVVPSYLSKGIEFDAVIIYNASVNVYGKENVRRVFYTACTRAMHELHLFSIGKPTPFINEAKEEGFLEVK